jgi:hypothetical protein
VTGDTADLVSISALPSDMSLVEKNDKKPKIGERVMPYLGKEYIHEIRLSFINMRCGKTKWFAAGEQMRGKGAPREFTGNLPKAM